MKIRVGVLLVLGALVLLSACEPALGPATSSADEPLSSDGVVSSTLSLGNANIEASPSVRSLSSGDRVYFRSSDIEMWQITALSDISALTSSKYVRWDDRTVDYAQNHSLEYIIGDARESLVFSPDQDMMVGIDRSDLNPTWGENVASFIDAGKTVVSAMRLDVGSGLVTFEIDGAEQTVYAADGLSHNGINGNSVFFVDRAYLKQPMLITCDMQTQIINETATPASLGITNDQFDVAQIVHTSSNVVDGDTPMDVNGALIVPMDPVDIGSYDPATDTFDIVISWRIEDAVHLRDGEYFMDRRVGETCFDFDVRLEITPKL